MSLEARIVISPEGSRPYPIQRIACGITVIRPSRIRNLYLPHKPATRLAFSFGAPMKESGLMFKAPLERAILSDW